MYTVYVYLLDGLADWELGHVSAELSSGRYFRADAPQVALRTVARTRTPVRTMGGLTVVPDGTVADIAVDAGSVLLLPGALAWDGAAHAAVLDAAEALLTAGGTVAAICGATAALADRGLLDARPHTSNGPGYLDWAAPRYRGQAQYIDAPCVADGDLITAGAAGALAWARAVLARLEVLRPDTLAAWEDYFWTGAPEAFFALMGRLTADSAEE